MRAFIRRAGGRVVNAFTEKLIENPATIRALQRKYAPFDMIFTDVWQDYLLDHHAEIEEKLHVLCDGMDTLSHEVASTVAERFFYVAPRCRFDHAVLYRTDCLFTQDERDLQAECGRLMRVRQERGYWLPQAHSGLSISVFAQHNGLDLIPGAEDRLRGGSVIDGGAFIGDSALVISEFKPASIYCFEPNSDNCRYVEQTISHNALANVTIVNSGLAASEGFALISGHASEASLSVGSGSVPVTTIDSFCRARNISPVLIKLDVEGMEYEAIEGALDTIRHSKPLLIVSIYHNPRDFFEIKPRLQRLGLGYQFLIRRLDPFHLTNETVLICC